MTNVKGFIFDLDGVLTDTATYHLARWHELAQRPSIHYAARADTAYGGRRRMDRLNLIHGYGHQLNDYDEAQKAALAALNYQRYQTFIQSLTSRDILPGIPALLKKRKQAGLKLAIRRRSKKRPLILQRLGLSSQS